MGTTIYLILMTLAFVLFGIAIIIRKRQTLFVLLLVIGALLVASPFVAFRILTRDAYPWTIVVKRELAAGVDPKVIFIQEIEWITDYEKLKRRRGDVGSLLLDDKTTEKTWNVRGYVPLRIRAEYLSGTEEGTISRSFRDLPAGRYTFSLIFDANDRGSWHISREE